MANEYCELCENLGWLYGYEDSIEKIVIIKCHHCNKFKSNVEAWESLRPNDN